MSVTHKPWKPNSYDEGIFGLRIAIVGFSHHLKEDNDYPRLTKDVLLKVLKGNLDKNSFFGTVPRYFGFGSSSEFWRRVAFFNFLPSAVGLSHAKYGLGTPEQIEAGKKRFLKTLIALEPDCTIVFTTKGWTHCPSTKEELEGRQRLRLRSNPHVTWGRYQGRGRELPVFGMRHPQGAPKSEMVRAVNEVLRVAKRLQKRPL